MFVSVKNQDGFELEEKNLGYKTHCFLRGGLEYYYYYYFFFVFFFGGVIPSGPGTQQYLGQMFDLSQSFSQSNCSDW